MTEPVIELSDVSRRYDEGPPALDGVSLTSRPGEAVAILGPSGSGKSTLLNLVAGLDRPTSGTVTVDGVRVDQLGEAGLRPLPAGQDRHGVPVLQPAGRPDRRRQRHAAGAAGRDGPARAAQRRAAELLGTLGIDRHARAYPGRLSGGERQRVAVARALMNRPALLLADEPTGALDTASGEDVRQLLNDLHADGQTIVLVTHDLALAEACATRTVQLVDGRIAADTALEPVR